MFSTRTAGVVALAVLFLIGISVGIAVGQTTDRGEPGSERVVGGPDIELSVLDNRLQPGKTQAVDIQMSNSGDLRVRGSEELEQRVKTARNLRLSIDGGSLPEGIEVRSGTALVGSLPEGSGQPVSFRFDISDGIEPGEYDIPVVLEYDHTRVAERFESGNTRFRDFSRERTEDVAVVVEDDAVFSASPVSSDVIAGDTGEFEIELENTGSRTAYNPRVTFSSEEEGIFFGSLEEQRAQKTVGTEDLETGETRRIGVTTGASSSLDPGRYPVDIEIRYETGMGVERTSRTITTLLETGEEQSFSVSELESSLRVGQEGDLTGEIVNEGPQTVENTVFVFEPESSNIDPTDGEHAVGSLEPGESAEFEYRVSVSSETEEGPRQSTVRVRYRNSEGDMRTYDKADIQYEVAKDRDEFSLESNLSVPAGSASDAEVEVTNIDDQTLTNIEAKIFTNDPISSGDDEAFIPELEPNESETIVFGLSAGGGGTEKTYPVSVDFRYDDERGDTQISDSYRVPVSVVTRSSEGGSSTLLIGAVVVILGAAGWLSRGRVKDMLG